MTLHRPRQLANIKITKDIDILVPAGTHALPIFRYGGSITIHSHYGRITAITTLSNLTDLYLYISDGMVTAKLSRGDPGGVDLSGAPVGTLGTKEEVYTQPYTLLEGDCCRSFEPTDKRAGFPVILNARDGVDNFIGVCFTTTDNPVDFSLRVVCEYEPLFSDSFLEFYP